MFATWAIVAFYAWLSGGFGQLLPRLGTFVIGNLNEVRAFPSNFALLFPFGAAAVALMVPVSFAIALVVQGIHGAGNSHSLRKHLPRWMRQPKNQFLGLVTLLLAEEMYARWLFLGLLTMIPWFSGNIAFYVLFLLGNATWTLVHLFNYKNRSERQILRVLPQFVSGVVLTVVFVNFGLLGALLVHIAFDMIIFSADRIGVFNIAEMLIIGYRLIIAGVSWALLQKPLTDLLGWFKENQVFALPGWHFGDYFWALLFISSVLTIVAEVLLYDQVAPDLKKEGGIVSTFLGSIFAVIIVLGLFTFVGLFTGDLGTRLIVIAIGLLMLSARSASGSGVARIFWFGLPEFALSVCAVVALSFWAGVFLVFLSSLLSVPEKVIRAADIE